MEAELHAETACVIKDKWLGKTSNLLFCHQCLKTEFKSLEKMPLENWVVWQNVDNASLVLNK